MEIRRINQTSNFPIETETREAPQQPTTSRGVAETSDSFVTTTQQDPLSLSDTTVAQPSGQDFSARAASDPTLQEQLQKNLLQANIFQIAKKQKLDFGEGNPVVLIRLSNVTGKSMAELQALFNKYGLDSANLPKPPNSQVAALFNDPAFDGTLNNLKANVSSSYQELEDHINSAKSNANSINSSNVASDTSVIDNLDTSPFKFLNDAYHHRDPYSKAVAQARTQLADRTGDLLSAMYPGENIKSNPAINPQLTPEEKQLQQMQEKMGISFPPKSYEGAIQFGNTILNPCPLSSTGQIQFGNSPVVDWPPVTRVPWYYDHEGDAAINPPSWMVDDGYPRTAYDN